MVKNEAERIAQCIESCRGLVDRVFIIDTGSTDSTYDVAVSTCKGIDVPLTYKYRPWVGFGHNRNELIAAAGEHANYLLLMDGDETLAWGEAKPEWPPLSADAYYLNYAGVVTYAHPRLIRTDMQWRFTDGVHSALEPVGKDIQPVFLAAPEIVHHGQTRHGREKLKTDVIELANLLLDDEHNTRAAFHLAKALEGLDYYDEAIEAYRRRIEMGGWDEEVFYSRYRMGMLQCSQVGFDVGVETLLAAWRERPWRAEPLRAISAATAEIADNIPLPIGEIMMVHRDAYSGFVYNPVDGNAVDKERM